MLAQAEPYRHMPYDVEVEQALLGSILIDNQIFWRIADKFAPPDFYDPLHQRIAEAMVRHLNRGETVTPFTLHADMKADPGLNEVGGINFLANLAFAAPAGPLNVESYVRIGHELALRRKLIQIGEDLLNEASTAPDDISAESIAAKASEALYDAVHALDTGDGPEPLVDVALRFVQAAEEARRDPDKAKITTGIDSVDTELGGLFPGRLTVIGAPPSAGKSGLVAQMAKSGAKANHPGIIFSIEMRSEEIAGRYVAADVGVPVNRIEEGRTTDRTIEEMALVARDYADIPLRIDSESNPTVAQLRSKILAMSRRHGRIAFVVVDHLRLIQPTDLRAPEHERLDQITRDLKALAKDFNIAVLLVSTLNREFYKRASKRPLMSDLYGASAIEYHADFVWFLHREEYWLEREQPPETDAKAHGDWERKLTASRGKAELFAAKRRSGPLGTVMLKFDAPFVRFAEL
jgi:replicative DNA helicase